MVLITGAAGKTGQALIQAFSDAGVEVRAFVRRQEQGEVALEAGAGKWSAGDLLDPEALRQALVGVSAVYHIPPNVSPDELAIGRAAIQAAREAGVSRFIYHSVLHPQIEAMPHHWQKMRVEEALIESGLSFTIVQPAVYMQNVLAAKNAVLEEGRYEAPYGPGTRLALVDLLDLAEAAVQILNSDDHIGATYELAGREMLDQDDLVEIMSQVIGRKVSYHSVPLEEWREKARSRGLGLYQVDALSQMFRYYDSHGLEGSGRVLEWLLGRRPNDFRRFCTREFEHRDRTGLTSRARRLE